MKEFVVYTLLRIALFAGTLAVVVGIWALLADNVFVPGALIVAFVVSGLASLAVLNRPREAFARRVQERATRASQAIEERRSREDAGDDSTRDAPDADKPDA